MVFVPNSWDIFHLALVSSLLGAQTVHVCLNNNISSSLRCQELNEDLNIPCQLTFWLIWLHPDKYVCSLRITDSSYGTGRATLQCLCEFCLCRTPSEKPVERWECWLSLNRQKFSILVVPWNASPILQFWFLCCYDKAVACRTGSWYSSPWPYGSMFSQLDHD